MRVRQIDSLRGVAIILVMLSHSTNIYNFGYLGIYGVQLFFILSAFSIFLSLKETGILNMRNIISFYAKRFFRIAPMFYLAMVIYFFFYDYSFLKNVNDFEWWKILLTILFLHGLHVESINLIPPGSWSITTEFFFYLLCPILFQFFKTLKKCIYAFIFFSLLGLFLSSSHFYSKIIDINNYKIELINWYFILWFPSHFFCFFVGIGIFHLYKKGSLFYIKKININFFFIFLVFLQFILSFSHTYKVVSIIFALIFFFQILIILYYPIKIFDNQILSYLGKISYSLYLIHFIVIQKLNLFIHMGSVYYLICFFIISIFISTFTYYFIENKFIFLGKKILKN